MSADRGEVMLLTPVMPASRGNGLAMRAGLFLEGLARSHSVLVVLVPLFADSPLADDLVQRVASGFARLGPQGPRDPRLVARALLATADGRERARTVYPRPELCRLATADTIVEVARLAAGMRLCHVLRLYMAPFLDAVLDSREQPADSRPRLTLDVDEFDADIHRELGNDQEAERYERLERYYLPRFDGLYAACPRDATRLRVRTAAAVVEVVPNAVRAPATRPAPVATASAATAKVPAATAKVPAATAKVPAAKKASPERGGLLFVGNLAYAPNAEAAAWLCEHVAPLLEGVSIAIVGSSPGPAVRALAEKPGVTVAADVAEVAPWYERCAIAVVPIWAGGGTRTKIPEALLHGRPVVSTPIGAAGIALRSDDGVLVADTPGRFAAACRRLLEDPALAARLAAHGGRRVRDTLTVEHVAQRIDELTHAMLVPVRGAHSS